METLSKITVLCMFLCLCYSQPQLAFQRALQDRLNAMRMFLMQRMAQSQAGANGFSDQAQSSSSADVFRQMFGLQGNVLSGGAQMTSVRQNRNLPNVVTLNDPNTSNLLNTQSNNIVNDNNIVRTETSENLNSVNPSSGNTGSNDENLSSSLNAGGRGGSRMFDANSQSEILLPDSTTQTNTSSMSQMFTSPFSFPTSSASFWMSSSSGANAPTPTQPSDTTFISIFSGSPSSSLSSSSRTLSSSSHQPFDMSTWNRFMTGSGSSGPTSVTMPESDTSTQEPVLKCTDEYKNLAGHTLCMTDDAGVSSSGITPADKQMITRFHNELRSQVQPPAEDLMELKWDERLAAVAEKWAKQCTLGHDKERTVPEIGMSVGQNVAVGYRTWRRAIQTWYDEVHEYRYGYEPDTYLGPGGWRAIAHYTQIVYNTTQLIGCGYAECPNTEYVRYYVCNYASGQSELAFPYTAGSRCGRCMNYCKNGLCDCGDLVCYNKGHLDPSTCTCDCPKPYKGRSCETLDCPAEDNWVCGRDWPVSYCEMYSNIKGDCPYMCGLCSGGNAPVFSAPNQTFTSNFGCTYSGLRGTPAECLDYGNKGADMSMCKSEGGGVGCGECERYFNIKKDYCPVMCGLCDPPCKGMKCSNGGTLDTGTCKCSCRLPFTGDTCEYAQCPLNGDPAFCQFWPRRYCRLYYNVPEECPYMCGICKKDSLERKGNTS